MFSAEEPAKWLDWEDGQPNNWGGTEDCVTLNLETDKMRDDVCEQRNNNVICKVPPSTQFMLRGVCISHPVDTFYMTHTNNELIGFTQTSMSLSNTSNRWEIRFTYNRTLLAFTNQSEFPIGRHLWYFVEGNACSEINETYRFLSLHLNVEQPGSFCCGDGSCISSDDVCDTNLHCPDRLDNRQMMLRSREANNAQ